MGAQDTVPRDAHHSGLNQLLVLTINFIAFVGVAVIAYGVVAIATADRWRILENTITFLAVVSTLSGTFLTAMSVYFPINTRPPDDVSRRFTAPLVICLVAATGVLFLFRREWVHPHVINGLAILAIAGGLFRTVSR